MSFLYHRVPPRVEGTTLYPLNRLKDIYPEAYEQGARKYQGRRALQRERIPILGNCLWNDVLFLMAVHPEEFRKAWESLLPPLRPRRFYQIDSATLDHNKLAVLTRMGVNEPRGYEPFSESRIHAYNFIPEETFAYWEEEKAAGESPFLFMHIPHILYRGAIDVSKAPIIELEPREQ